MSIYKALFRVHKDNLLVKKQNNKNNTLKTQKRDKLYIKSNFNTVSFGDCFEDCELCRVSDVFVEGVPEGGSSYWEGSVTPGLVLGPVRWREEVCVGGVKGTGRVVVVEQVGEMGGRLDERGGVFWIWSLWDWEPEEFLEDGCGHDWVWKVEREKKNWNFVKTLQKVDFASHKL